MDWQPVLLAAACPPCDCCGEPFCITCRQHYADCPCPGPHQDEFEYREIGGCSMARSLTIESL